MKLFKAGNLSLLLCIVLYFPAFAQEVQNSEPITISHVGWSSYFNQVLVTLRGGGLFVYDPVTRSTLVNMSDNLTGDIEDASFQPNGTRIVTVDRFSGLRIWDTATSELIYSDHEIRFAWQADWSPDGRWIITGNMDAMFVRDDAGNPLFEVYSVIDDIPDVAFSPDQRFLAISFTYTFEVYDLIQRQSVVSHIIPGFRRSIQWSSDGSAILAAVRDALREGTFYNIVVLDPFSGERLRTYSGFPSELTSAHWSPDESQILATSIDGTVYIVDAVSGDSTVIFRADSPVLSADWSPYGGQVAIGAPLNTGEAVMSVNTDTMQRAPLPLSIIVPDPSPARLAAIAAACAAPPSVMQAITGLSASSSVSDSPANLTAESVATLDWVLDAALDMPPGCVADLRAVADALTGE